MKSSSFALISILFGSLAFANASPAESPESLVLPYEELAVIGNPDGINTVDDKGRPIHQRYGMGCFMLRGGTLSKPKDINGISLSTYTADSKTEYECPSGTLVRLSKERYDDYYRDVQERLKIHPEHNLFPPFGFIFVP